MKNKYDKYILYKRVLLVLLVITIFTAITSFFYKYALIISVISFILGKIISNKLKGLKKK